MLAGQAPEQFLFRVPRQPQGSKEPGDFRGQFGLPGSDLPGDVSA
jgi:hypothetical protein